ncbi:hypothetical protein O181_020870 [Austropuccinia psidii MF-1]|uniref:Uncharacterized protein n=1 Tax=Austropuccinia psidii MF-1 TaxID=1389203 RepID=A0A9Q3CEL3_9BASI|nr:hypothetical protein [Austropuccinia psidii MF-1]
MKYPNRPMLRWQIVIQEYKGNMRILHQKGKVHKNAYGLIIWPFTNTPYSPSYLTLEDEPQILIEGINITYVGTELCEEVRKYYKKGNNCNLLTIIIEKDFKDTCLGHLLDELWKCDFDDGKPPVLWNNLPKD